MWNNPHILVMDEPTNYLDRDSLVLSFFDLLVQKYKY